MPSNDQELTGRRQWRQTSEGLVLQVECSEFSPAQSAHMCYWRDALASDLTGETIVDFGTESDLPDHRG